MSWNHCVLFKRFSHQTFMSFIFYCSFFFWHDTLSLMQYFNLFYKDTFYCYFLNLNKSVYLISLSLKLLSLWIVNLFYFSFSVYFTNLLQNIVLLWKKHDMNLNLKIMICIQTHKNENFSSVYMFLYIWVVK